MKFLLISTRVLLALMLVTVVSGCGKNGESNSISASGTIESVNVTISSKTSGTINKINFKPKRFSG